MLILMYLQIYTILMYLQVYYINIFTDIRYSQALLFEHIVMRGKIEETEKLFEKYKDILDYEIFIGKIYKFILYW
jgi:hypothetical protein